MKSAKQVCLKHHSIPVAVQLFISGLAYGLNQFNRLKEIPAPEPHMYGGEISDFNIIKDLYKYAKLNLHLTTNNRIDTVKTLLTKIYKREYSDTNWAVI